MIEFCVEINIALHKTGNILKKKIIQRKKITTESSYKQFLITLKKQLKVKYKHQHQQQRKLKFITVIHSKLLSYPVLSDYIVFAIYVQQQKINVRMEKYFHSALPRRGIKIKSHF